MSQMFVDYVKTIYRESEVERDTKVVKWPPTPSTVYINLACINRKNVSAKSREYTEITEAMVRDGNVDVINTTKGPIEFSEIAKRIIIPFDKRSLILVEGAPGVGKSTFAWEFCRRWERGEIAQQYQLVLLLRLRDDRISRAKSLKDLIYHPSKRMRRAVTEELMHSHHFHALIILEGFDELPDHRRNDQSIFFQLIAGKLLPLATVLVTSRPWATERIRRNYGNHVYQHIEILGFTSQQITEYIERTVPQDKGSELKVYLEKHPQIRSGMYIPLNSAIVVTVYQESQESGCALPTTLTELYTPLVYTLLLRYLHGHPQYETTTIQTFSDLPPAVYSKFSEVCKLAYSGIVGSSDHVQLIFTGLPSDFDSLGLMDSVTELYVTQGPVSSHNFLHLTFQEYFAAVHISTLSPAEQLEHFQGHNEGRLKVVLRFLAGLNKLSCFSKENVHHFLTPPQDEGSSPYSIPVDVGVTTDLLNWIFEAQSSDVIPISLEMKTVDISLHQNMLPLDYYCLGYCIAHSQCQWVVLIDEEQVSLGIEEMRMLVVGVNTAQQPSGRIVGLTVGEYAYEVLNMLFMKWKSVLHLRELSVRLPVACNMITWPDLSALRVLRLEISDKTSWRLDTLLPHLSLESLTIQGYSGDVSLVYEDCVAIADHITAVGCLKELCFISYDENDGLVVIGDKGMEAITKALADNQSPLERLDLELKCKFTDTAADCLAQFISNTAILQYLTIWWSTLSAHGLLELARAIHVNSTLQKKTLEGLRCTVNGDDEAKDFAQLLLEYPQVEGRYEHEIMFSLIGDAGALALAQALYHNSTLKELDLSNNSISDAGAVTLAQALHHNSTLKELCLSNNSISDAGAVALAQALHHNATLKELDLSNNSISDAGAVTLAQALHYNSTLKKLYLSNNSISDAGAVKYSDVIGRHCVDLSDAIRGDLGTISNRFLALRFVTRTARDDILCKQGISSREKANQLLSLVTLSHDRSHDKKEWFNNFISVFSSEAAYEGLVSALKMETNALILIPHYKHSTKTSRKRKVDSETSDIFTQTTKRVKVRRQLPYTSGHHSEQFLNDGDPPQSVRQAPGREHYQSQQGPTAWLHTTHKQSQNISSGSRSSEIKSPMDVFIDYVKDTYRQRAIEKDLNVIKWPPAPCEVFISLAYINRSTALTEAEVNGYTRAMVEDGNIDAILQKKDCSIDFDDIARGLPQTDFSQNVIVVEGAPGVGKSTFAWEFCRRWERGEIAQQYQLVLLLRLRDDRISKAKSLKDLIYHPQQGICQGVLHELLGNGGVNTLIILEGFDELPDKQRKLSSLFGQLILGNVLLHATILVTSGHYAVGVVMRNISPRVFQHIEVLGFTEESIERYVTSVFTGKEVGAHSLEESSDEVSEEAKKNINDLIKYLDTYPQIKACLYIPLNAAIVVSIYKESKKRMCMLPKTLTELYYSLTQVLLLRHLCGHSEHKQREWNIDSFESDLPDEVYTQLLSISKIAYDGISRKWRESVQLIFSDLPAGFETLGFMQSVSQLYVIHGQKMSHNFLHLTVQEFLAALYIQTTMTPAEQLEHFKRHKEGRLKVVLRFLAGLTKLKTVTHEQLRGLLGEPHIEQSEKCQSQYCNPIKADVCVSAHHTNWLFETQNPDLVQSLLHNHTAEFIFTSEMLQLEYYSAGYCIAHSHCNCMLLTFEEDANEEKLGMFVDGVESGDSDPSRIALKTTEPMSNDKLNLLWKYFGSCIEELYLTVPKSLSLSNLSALRMLELRLHAVSTIKHLSVNCLETLTIIGAAWNAVSIESSKAISKLLSSSNSLKEFCVKQIVRYKPMEVIVKGMCDNKALPLKRLEICGEEYQDSCSLSTTASSSLGQFITRSPTLQYLRISFVEISGQGLIPLLTAIQNCSSLQEKMVGLTLVFDDEWSDVSTEEVRASLTQLINDHPHMIDVEESLRDLSASEENYIKASVIALSCDYCFRIYLNNKSITDAGAVALAQALHHNSTLKELYLSNNSIGDAGAVALAQALHHSSTLKELYLSNNSISDAGAVALAQALHHNSTLKELDLSNNIIRDVGAEALAQALHHNSTLEKLDLSNNSISDAGAVALAQALHHNSTLKELYLSNNSISDAGAVALAQALHHNSNLKELYLSNNSISDAGAVALAQALHHNSTLKKLDLYGNDGIGEESTYKLVQALTVNTSITRGCGLIFPERCEEYVIQFELYHTGEKTTVKQKETDIPQLVSEYTGNDVNISKYTSMNYALHSTRYAERSRKIRRREGNSKARRECYATASVRIHW